MNSRVGSIVGLCLLVGREVGSAVGSVDGASVGCDAVTDDG